MNELFRVTVSTYKQGIYFNTIISTVKAKSVYDAEKKFFAFHKEKLLGKTIATIQTQKAHIIE